MLQILDLFNRAAEIGADITLTETRVPGAEVALRAWAIDRKLELDDDTHTVADDHPMEAWRGMVVSTVTAQLMVGTSYGSRICVHRRSPISRKAPSGRQMFTAHGSSGSQNAKRKSTRPTSSGRSAVRARVYAAVWIA